MLNRLQELRIKHNYSHQDMAKKLNISKSFYYQIEKNKRTLKYELAMKIADIFNLKPDDIFYEDFQNNISSKK